VQKVLNLSLHRIRSLLRPDLADTPVLASSQDGLAAFPLTVRERLFNIHVLARFHGPDGSQTVPVVACGNDDGVDRLVFDQTTQVFPALRFGITFFRSVQSSFVWIAQTGNVHSGEFVEFAHQSAGAAAATDETHVNFLVGTRGECGDRRKRKCGSCESTTFQNIATGQLGHVVFLAWISGWGQLEPSLFSIDVFMVPRTNTAAMLPS